MKEKLFPFPVTCFLLLLYRYIIDEKFSVAPAAINKLPSIDRIENYFSYFYMYVIWMRYKKFLVLENELFM